MKIKYLQKKKKKKINENSQWEASCELMSSSKQLFLKSSSKSTLEGVSPSTVSASIKKRPSLTSTSWSWN